MVDCAIEIWFVQSRPIFRRAGSLILCGRWEGQTRKWQFSSIKSECMEINGKFLVGFRNYNKDKQVSVIVFENSINSILNESLSSSFIKVDLDYYYIQGLGFLVRRRTRKPSFFLQLTVELTVQIWCVVLITDDLRVW